jgi:hypothetical protein
MFCRPVILCSLNCVTETFLVTAGRMLASPLLYKDAGSVPDVKRLEHGVNQSPTI